MSRSSSDSPLEAIRPATVADQLFVASLDPEWRRRMKAVLFDEVEEEIGNQACEYHDQALWRAENRLGELRKVLIEIKETAEAGRDEEDPALRTAAIDRVQTLVDQALEVPEEKR
jgi:aminoglycoside phosphotransferase family enzyme